MTNLSGAAWLGALTFTADNKQPAYRYAMAYTFLWDHLKGSQP